MKNVSAIWGDVLTPAELPTAEELENRAWMIELFLNYGADPNPKYEKFTIWH
jgi:hypothetical protein